jgi:hypothetical protein
VNPEEEEEEEEEEEKNMMKTKEKPIGKQNCF